MNQESSVPKERKCSRCGEVKPLDLEHFQKVKFFKIGFSYYCNVCDKPTINKENPNK